MSLNKKATRAEISSVNMDKAMFEIRQCENDVERAFYLHDILGHRKCAIIQTGLVTLNQWRLGKKAKKEGRRLGIRGQPEYFSLPHKTILLSNFISSFGEKKTKPNAQRLSKKVRFLNF